MPTPATDRHRVILIAIGVTALALAAGTVRSINAALAVANKPQPTADVQSLTAFLGPLPDSVSLARVASGTMVVDRDPFASAGAGAVPAGVTATGATQPRPRQAGGQWIVSSILFEDSRRSAIVNNAWVTVGDPLGGGARLTAIERKHVIVTDAKGIRHVVPIRGG